ncbi:MAG: hypothetical protein EPO28_08635 [Saprospiraceae bacterium]|nr:MAG: hypothetical protein EPO28_08635 [Saprospiraceae bacterium]
MEDKSEKYLAILADILNSLANWWNNAPGDVKNEVIIDKEKRHILMVSTGRNKDRFEYLVLFHFKVQDGKIWVLKNNTDEDLDRELWKQGVPIKDIVVGRHSDFERNLKGYEYGMV